MNEGNRPAGRRGSRGFRRTYLRTYPPNENATHDARRNTYPFRQGSSPAGRAQASGHAQTETEAAAAAGSTPITGVIDQTVPDNGTSTVDLGSTTDIAGAHFDYHCSRGSDVEGGSFNVITDGANAYIILWQHSPGASGNFCNVDFVAAIVAGVLQLTIRANTITGNAADFRATGYTIAA